MNVLAEYRPPGDTVWHTCVGSPGETLDELAAALVRMWPGSEVRDRETGEPIQPADRQTGQNPPTE